MRNFPIVKVIFVLLILGPFALPFFYIVCLNVALAEFEGLEAGSFLSYLFIPAEIRALDLPGRCSPLEYERTFEDCGGSCGIREYTVYYGTTLTSEELEAFIFQQDLSFLGEERYVMAYVCPYEEMPYYVGRHRDFIAENSHALEGCAVAILSLDSV